MVRQNWRLWSASVDVEKILSQPETQNVERASTFGGENLEHRVSRVSWCTGNFEISELLAPYIKESASVFDIDCSQDCEIQYTEYRGSEHGKYDWHHDVDWNQNTGTDRKLSLTVQLSDPDDYEGGRFEFSDVEAIPDTALAKGSVLVFPSYLAHRVTPVTRGVRKSLVAWFTGPQWR